MVRLSRLVMILAVLLVFFAFGCAEEEAVKKADNAVKLAKESHADYLAPYEYASAEQYLAEAHKQLNESDYQGAAFFAKRAGEKADASAAIARQRNSKPMVTWIPPEGYKIPGYPGPLTPVKPEEVQTPAPVKPKPAQPSTQQEGK